MPGENNGGAPAGNQGAGTTPPAGGTPAGTTPPAGGEGGGQSSGSFFTPPAGSDNSFLSSLPEEFRTDPTFKDYKSMPDFLKSHKNMASLVGKKAIERPGDNATPEQIKAFRAAIGVPETADGYKFDDVDLSSYGEAANAFKKELGDFREIFMEIGIPAKEANALQQKYWNKLAEGLKAVSAAGEAKRAEEAAKFDAEFAQMNQQRFGEKAEAVVSGARDLMAEFASKEDIEIIQKLDNKTLFAFLNTLNGVREKYMSEGNPPANGGSHTSVQSEEAARSEAKNLYSELRKLDAMDPKRREIQDKINAIYAKLPAEKEDTTKRI